MSEILKSNSEQNEFEDLQATLAQLSQKYTILMSNMENEKHKNATQTNLLELRSEIIRNMQDNDDYYKMRIISLLKDIEIEQKKSKNVNLNSIIEYKQYILYNKLMFLQFDKMEAAHQEELNNMFFTLTEAQNSNTQLKAELHKIRIGKQSKKKNIYDKKEY